MARILFSAFSNINWTRFPFFDPFYIGFIKSLRDYGNEVLVLRTNDFLFSHDNCVCQSNIDTSQLVSDIKNFNPDLIMTPNNALPVEISNNTACPIFIYSADSPAYYANKDGIKNNIDRYMFIHIMDTTLSKACKKLFKCKDDQIIHTGYYTTVQPELRKFLNDIVFIGSIGWPQIGRHRFQQCRSQQDLQSLLNQFDTTTKNPENWDRDFLQLLTFSERVKTLDSLTDFALKIYGMPYCILESIPYSIGIARCFDCKQIITIKKTQDVLNESKIAPTLFNAQARNCLSWRVADIMASNACLISPPNNDLQWISPYIEIPTYKSPLECKELCKKLLNDDVYRGEIVKASQVAINEKCRFKHLFKILESNTKFNFISRNEGMARWIKPHYKFNFIYSIKQTNYYKKFKKTKYFTLAKKFYRFIIPYHTNKFK